MTESIPKGYQKTEIGIIPEDWEVKRLGEISNIKTGKRNGNEEVEEGKYPFFVRSQKVKKINSYSFEGEAILIPGEGGIGTIIHYINGKFDYHQRVYKISNFKDSEVAKFIYYSMIKNFDNHAQKNSVKATVDSLRLPTFIEFEYPAPKSPVEQSLIAQVLSNTDELIESLTKLIEKKKNIKQGAMQQLLTGNKRLEGFSGEWEEKRLGDVAEMSSGGTPLTSNNSFYGGQIPWVVIADMTRIKKYLFDTEKTITEQGLLNSSAKLFKKGTLLFAMYASIGKCAIANVDVTCNQAILGIDPKKIDTEFLYYYLAFNEQKFIQMGQAGTQNNLNKEIVQNLTIPYPPLKEQSAIASILSDMDSEIESLEAKRDKYINLKQGMMQELLTGRIRLKW